MFFMLCYDQCCQVVFSNHESLEPTAASAAGQGHDSDDDNDNDNDKDGEPGEADASDPSCPLESVMATAEVGWSFVDNCVIASVTSLLSHTSLLA
jgi:hypothetical protein